MSKLAYTSIPDTTDTGYWEVKRSDAKQRFTMFVPKDKELHRQLQEKAWGPICARRNRDPKTRH